MENNNSKPIRAVTPKRARDLEDCLNQIAKNRCVEDVSSLRNSIEKAGEAQAKRLFKRLIADDIDIYGDFENTFLYIPESALTYAVYYAEAVMGWVDAVEITKLAPKPKMTEAQKSSERADKRAKAKAKKEALARGETEAPATEDTRPRIIRVDGSHAKAFGLLPLSGADEHEVVNRYLMLLRFGTDSIGDSKRKAKDQKAMRVGINHLAQVAGYTNVESLERAMEVRIAQDARPDSSACVVGEYQLEIQWLQNEPQIVIERAGKTLNSVPAVVSIDDAYQQLRSTIEGLRAQSRRVQTLFERLMTNEAALTPEEIMALSRLLMVRRTMEQLIWMDDAGFGMLNVEAMTLQDRNGDPRAVTQPLRIPHSFHLFEAGQLSAWQQEMVRRRIVQPFKQAFRELYVLTPAEEQTDTFSNRFSGHELDLDVATALFDARGWIVNGSSELELGEQAHKQFSHAGIRATFHSSDTFIDVTGRIEFNMPLKDVPPLVFSETMRDADLVVSVAGLGDDKPVSSEVYLRRAEAIRALLDDIGVSGVTTQGHFARVKGKLASYRVHLGSAAIHIEPGNYLCIVPDSKGKNEPSLFLPFGDAGDSKIMEVVSKILLLKQDDQIKDESILRQIRAASA